MSRPESNTTQTQGAFVPAQRTAPEMSLLDASTQLDLSQLSSSAGIGYAVFSAADLGINSSLVQGSAAEFRNPDTSPLEPADNGIGIRHHVFSADLSRQTAVLHDQPKTQELIDRLTEFIRSKMERHPDFRPTHGWHAGLKTWSPVVRIDHYQIASDAEGGRAAVNSFVSGNFERRSPRNRVLSARIALRGTRELEIARDGESITRAVPLHVGQVLLSREVGLIADDDKPIFGPSIALRRPTNHLILTAYNY